MQAQPLAAGTSVCRRKTPTVTNESVTSHVIATAAVCPASWTDDTATLSTTTLKATQVDRPVAAPVAMTTIILHAWEVCRRSDPVQGRPFAANGNGASRDARRDARP